MSAEKLFAKHVQLGLGTDYLKGKTTIQASRGNTLEVTPMGIIAISGKNSRRLLIPWANIRGVELLKEGEELPVDVSLQNIPAPNVARGPGRPKKPEPVAA